MTTFSASDMVLESILVSKLRQQTHGADLQLSEYIPKLALGRKKIYRKNYSLNCLNLKKVVYLIKDSFNN